jgi:formylglycine-generating enzyme required for sulfatase activity
MMFSDTKIKAALTGFLALAVWACGGAQSGEEASEAPAVDIEAARPLPGESGDTDEAVDTEPAGGEGQDDVERGDFVKMAGGTFTMGSADGDADERPAHSVTVPPFEILRAEVTVAEYEKCVFMEKCHWPPDKRDAEGCNWGHGARSDHPINCVDWDQAKFYCEWIGGRLPTEAEWEFAARSGGKDFVYPWGDEEANCDLATMATQDGNGCGEERTGPVCAKTAGNTAQGLCDMAGNVAEWVEDKYHAHYNGAPSDGSAWPAVAEKHRVIRGGSWLNAEAKGLRAAERVKFRPNFGDIHNGFRCAR